MGVAAAAPALAAVEEPNSFEQITNYNNFYEFGFGKTDPADNAGALTTDPWAVEIGGLVDRPGSYSVADLDICHAIADFLYNTCVVAPYKCSLGWGVLKALPVCGVQSHSLGLDNHKVVLDLG